MGSRRNLRAPGLQSPGPTLIRQSPKTSVTRTGRSINTLSDPSCSTVAACSASPIPSRILPHCRIATVSWPSYMCARGSPVYLATSSAAVAKDLVRLYLGVSVVELGNSFDEPSRTSLRVHMMYEYRESARTGQRRARLSCRAPVAPADGRGRHRRHDVPSRQLQLRLRLPGRPYLRNTVRAGFKSETT